MMISTKHLNLEYVDPATLVAAPYNPRGIADAALRRLAALLDAHGFVDPVIARREDKLIIGGHQRLKANALRDRPDPVVPVVFLDGVSDARAKALNVALNNQQAQGEYDMPKLADLLESIDTGEFDVPRFTAFPGEQIAGLVDGLEDRPPPEPDIPETWQVVVQCDDEAHQRTTYDRLAAEGYPCRLLTL